MRARARPYASAARDSSAREKKSELFLLPGKNCQISPAPPPPKRRAEGERPGKEKGGGVEGERKNNPRSLKCSLRRVTASQNSAALSREQALLPPPALSRALWETIQFLPRLITVMETKAKLGPEHFFPFKKSPQQPKGGSFMAPQPPP